MEERRPDRRRCGIGVKGAVRRASEDDYRHYFEIFVVGRNTVGQPLFSISEKTSGHNSLEHRHMNVIK
ncbi:hypothetical protein CapIbe_013977 [Capra ibex]